MSDLVQIRFDYGVLDEETRVFIKVKTAAIQARLKRTAEDIIAIGQDLKEVQERLKRKNEGQGFRGENQGNGQFLAWLSSEFEMSHMTAYRFMSVADKFGDGEKFNTVLNFSPKILYELAAASDEIIQRVEDGEIKASEQQSLLEAIKEAKREAKEKEEQLKVKQRELDLFQSNKQLQDEKLKTLEESLKALEEDKKRIEQSRVQILREDLPETKEKLQDLEQKLEDLESQKQRLQREKDQKAERVKVLTEEIQKYALVDKQEKRNEQIRNKWRQACDAFHQGVNQGCARLVTSIDAQQAFESDDWARLAEVEATLKQALEKLASLRESVTSQFVEASMSYVEA